jgi:hypothetical protein
MQIFCQLSDLFRDLPTSVELCQDTKDGGWVLNFIRG